MIDKKLNEFILMTEDKISLACEHHQAGFEKVIIVCPGFFNSKQNRWMKKTRDILSEGYDTVVFDFRGHGESCGKFTWSAKEYKDLEAVLNYLKEFNYKSVGILGYSLGAAAAINAVSRRHDVKSMMLISSPMSFWQINYHFWEPEMLLDLRDNIECDWEGKGARISHLLHWKRKPIEEIKKIKNTSIYFIHGTKDWIIKDYHSRKLFDAAVCPKRLKIIEGGFHAERLIQEQEDIMKTEIMNWFKETL